jgi:hypothetical protein
MLRKPVRIIAIALHLFVDLPGLRVKAKDGIVEAHT